MVARTCARGFDAWLGAARAQAYLADAYSYWTQHVNMEGNFDLRYLVRCRAMRPTLDPAPRLCMRLSRTLGRPEQSLCTCMPCS